MTKIEIVVVVAILLLSLIPLSFANKKDSSNAGTPESAIDSVEVSLDLDNAYLTYKGQTISGASGSIVVPEGSDIKFSVKPDEGFNLDGVYLLRAGGGRSKLGPVSGSTYVIGEDAVKPGIGICAETSEIPVEVEEVVPDVVISETELPADQQTEGAVADPNAPPEQPVDENAIVPGTQSSFSFQDSSVAVTAHLQDPAAIPAGAEFKVTPVTRGTSGYNYDAYMRALNNNLATENLTYSDQNTLLYDIAFMYKGKEYEPASGSVTIDIKFKNDQLTNKLEVPADSTNQVQINHLSIPEGKLESAGSTQQATNVSAGEITVTPVSSGNKSVTITGSEESAEFKLDSLSVVGITYAAPPEVLSNSIIAKVNFDDQDGRAVSPVPSLPDGMYLYAYLVDTNNANNKGVYMLQQNGESGYSVEITGYTYNNQFQALSKDTSYEITLFRTSRTDVNKDNYPQAKDKPLANGEQLANHYTVTLPAGNIVTTGATYTAVARPYGGSGSDTYESVLGAAVNFGIVTENFKLTGNDAQSNIAALQAQCNNQTGNDLTNNVEQTFIFAQVNGEFKIKGYDAYVRVPTEYAHLVKQLDNVHLLVDTSYTKEEITSQVQSLLDIGSASSARLAQRGDNAGFEPGGNDSYVIDTRGRGAGTYYVTLDDAAWSKVMDQSDRLRIYKDDGQTIVFNVTASNPSALQKFSVNGVGSDSLTNAGGEGAAKTLIWNFTKATSLKTSGSFTGVILAPHATFLNDATSSGWLIAKEVTVNSGEWHNIYQQVIKLSTNVTLGATKLIDSAPATKSGFKFALAERQPDGSFATIQTTTSSDANVPFSSITYEDESFVPDVTDGNVQTHVYRITETEGTQDDAGNVYMPDTAVYYVMVTVTKTVSVSTNNSTTSTKIAYFASKPMYFTDEACTQPVGTDLPAFDNKTRPNARGSVTFQGEKLLPYGTLKDGQFSFKVKQWWTEEIVATGTNKADGTIDFSTIEYTIDDLEQNEQGGYKDTAKFYDVTEEQAGSEVDGAIASTQKFAVGVFLQYDGGDKIKTDWRILEGGDSMTFTNNLKTGELQVTKSVTKSENRALCLPEDLTRAYTFRVELTNPLNGTYGDMTFTDGKATFTLVDGQTVSATKLPAGTGYTVTEDVPDDFTVSYVGNTGSIVAEQVAEVKATNTRKTGDLTLSKTLVSEAKADANLDFTFTVALDRPLSGTYGGMVFDKDGKASVTLRGGQSATATGLPVGVGYTITETASGGFTTSSVGAQGAITAGATQSANFTNTRDTGKLEVTKTVISDLAADKEQPFVFTVELSDKGITGKYGDMTFTNGTASFPLAHNQTATATDLPQGIAYKVTEAAVPGMITSSSGSSEGEISATDSKVAFSNTRATGGFVVSKKVVSPSEADHSKQFEFTATLGDSGINGTYGDLTFTGGKASFTLSDDGQPKVASRLPQGVSYLIEEKTEDGFVTVASGETGSVSENAAAISFTNTRDTGGLSVTKSVTGTWNTKQEFRFDVVLQDEGVSGTFGDMTFANGKATVTLQGGQTATATGLPAGVKYTVTEFDLPTGYKKTSPSGTASGTIEKDAIASAGFVNEYAASGWTTLSVNKTLLGREFDGGGFLGFGGDGFSFEIKAVTANAPMPQGGSKITIKPNSGHEASKAFGRIDFSMDDLLVDGVYQQSRVFEYQVTESASVSDIANDPNLTRKVLIKVSDTGAGTLDVEPLYEGSDSLDFTNTYRASGDITFAGSKVMNGRKLAAGERYTFKVEEQASGNAVPFVDESITNDDSGKIVFPKIRYTLDPSRDIDDRGDHVYIVSEQNANVSGVTSDTTVYAVKVHVEDAGAGKLRASITSITKMGSAAQGEGSGASELGANAKLDFANSYAASGSYTLKGSKALTGSKAMTAGMFSFVVMEGDTQVATGVNAGDGSISFSRIDYAITATDSSDLGEHTYRISEANAGKSINGITYDSAVKTVVVNVKDNGDGTLSTELVSSKSQDVAFSNAYVTQGSAPLKGGKTMVGRPFMGNRGILGTGLFASGDEFTFTVTANTGGPLPSKPTVTIKGADYANLYDAQLDFGSFAFTEADQRKTYTYTITETGQAAGVTLAGAKQVIVTVGADDGLGNIPATVEYEGEGLTFTNTYDATGSLVLEGAKSMTGRAITNNDHFNFQITDTFTPAGSTESTTTTTDFSSTGATIEFPSITYTLASLGTHQYSVYELNSEDPSVAKSDAVYEFTVTVEDNHDGTLKVTPSKEVYKNLAFENSYTSRGSAVISGTKKITGRPFMAGDAYTFTLSADAETPDAPLPTVKTKEIAPTSGEDVAFAFAEIPFTQAHAGKTYVYNVSETAVTGASVSRDTSIKKVAIYVNDKGDGTIEPQIVSEQSDEVVFTNAYTATGFIDLNGTKTLSGRSFSDSDSITFTLAGSDGAKLPGTTLLTLQGTAGASSMPVDFGRIDYDLDDVGKTYTYTITEKPSMVGVSDAEKSTTIDVTITDPYQNGTLVVTASPAANAATGLFGFANVYEAFGRVAFEGTKSIDTRQLRSGDSFDFVVLEGGETVATGSNDVTGKITFTPIEYALKDVGTHTYTVREEVRSANGITSSTAEHTVTVTVADNQTGELQVRPSANYTALDFVNSYTATGSLTFEGSKFMIGRKLAESETYSFAITETKTAVEGATPFTGTATSAAAPGRDSSAITFPRINYTLADLGTHEYTIVEQTTLPDGVSARVASYVVKVTVSDNYDGTLAPVITSIVRTDAGATDGPVTLPGTSHVDFTNVFEAETSITLAGIKTMAGRPLLDSDEFLFDVIDITDVVNADAANAESAPAATQSTASAGTIKATGRSKGGVISFPAITYTQEDIGKTYRYRVVERKTGIAGVKASDQVYEIVVDVSYDAATQRLVASTARSSVNPQALKFDNDYITKKTEAHIDPVKTLTDEKTGKEIALHGGEFTFELLDGTNVIQRVVNEDEGFIHFAPITYTQPGTYRYTIREVASDKLGISSDTKTYGVTVVVTDNYDTASLSAEVSYNPPAYPGQLASSFMNTYRSQDTSAALQVTKAIDGRDWATGDSFSFSLAPIGNAPMPTGNGSIATATSTSQTARFGTITYTEPGTYEYRITELKPDGVTAENRTLNGMTYDFSTHTACVEVIDNMAEGRLEVASITYDKSVVADNGTASALFTNVYNETSAVFQASKELSGAELSERSFEFELRGTSDNAQGTLRTASADVNGVVAFDPIIYTQEGTYEYEIAEVAGDEIGMTYDSAVHKAKVVVTRNDDGKLEAAEPTYDGSSTTPPAFKNAYFRKDVELLLNKYFFGDDPTSFNFTLSAAKANWTLRSGEPVAQMEGEDIVDTGENAFTVKVGNGAFDDSGRADVRFPKIAYTKTGTYYYLISEDEMPGYHTDDVQYLARVEVSEDKDPEISYQLRIGDFVMNAEDADPEFYNNNGIMLSFMAMSFEEALNSKDASANVYPTVRKVIKIPDETSEDQIIMPAPGQFEFVLSDETGSEVSRGVNDALGNVAFFQSGQSGLKYTLEDVGEHHYTISEVNGGNTIEGVEYDGKVIGLTVKVEENHGALMTSCTYEVNGKVEDDPTFENIIEGTYLKLKKVSRMGGEGLEKCTYALWMLNETGPDVLIDEATTDRNGEMIFKNVHLSLGKKYYFKEVIAPSGHKVDPYRSVLLTPRYNDKTGEMYLDPIEKTDDGLHPSGGQ